MTKLNISSATEAKVVSLAGAAPVQEENPLSGFTHRARKMLQLANQEAHRLNHTYVGPEHLLLALLKDDIGLASRVLRGFGCFLCSARNTLEPETSAANVVAAGKLG